MSKTQEMNENEVDLLQTYLDLRADHVSKKALREFCQGEIIKHELMFKGKDISEYNYIVRFNTYKSILAKFCKGGAMKKEICEKCFEELCSDCYQHLASLESKLKAHAVEVLASMIFQRKKMLRFSEEEARAEARALLGWDNDNNDKRKIYDRLVL